jgi:enediyne polyketide synthase
MGEVRETGLFPIMNKILVMAETGGWGLATNSSSTRILGELRTHDIIEVRLWFEKISGIKGGIFDTVFEWRKVLKNNKFERVALSKLRSTWIQIIGHGIAVPGELPVFLKEFADIMKPRLEKSRPLLILPETLKNFTQGKAILDFTKKKLLISQEEFKTALEDSNLIGNIYFANYPKWLGRVMDSYFFNIIPEFYIGNPKGEFLCLNCELEHLREAMPFDGIIIKMFLEKIFDRGINFYFEFYRLEKKVAVKLAFARTSMLWVGRNSSLDPIVSEMPKKMSYLLKL